MTVTFAVVISAEFSVQRRLIHVNPTRRCLYYLY